MSESEYEADDTASDWDRAAEWGLASLVLGATTLVTSTLAVGLVAAASYRVDEVRGTFWKLVVAAVGYAGWGGLMTLGVAGVRYGRRSAAAAERLGYPPARGQAGVLLAAVGIFAAVGAAIAWTVLWVDQLL